MLNKKYLFAAKNLSDRNRNRLNKDLSPEEKEKEQLFYWIMSRIEWSAQGCWPAQQSHRVRIATEHLYEDGQILLAHGKVSEYLSEYVRGYKFCSVMQEVCNIFNEIGKSEENGYHFWATFVLPEGKIENAEFIVNMATLM